jgi:hypothetical protein
MRTDIIPTFFSVETKVEPVKAVPSLPDEARNAERVVKLKQINLLYMSCFGKIADFPWGMAKAFRNGTV